MTADTETCLVTGFPSLMSRRVARKILESDGRTRVLLLASKKHSSHAESFRTSMGASRRRRLTLLEGEVTDMHLGLAGDEYRRACDGVTTLIHAAWQADLRVSPQRMADTNVGGTQNVLELARDCSHLRRFVHCGTVQVSGDRTGVVLEDELESGQRFRNRFEETMYQAEREVRAQSNRLPVTVLRLAFLVGDSRTGETDRFDGPNYVIVLIATSPPGFRLPFPGRGTAPLHVVPVDFVADATYALAWAGPAEGRTLHLVDPFPLGVRHFYDLVAARAQRKPPLRAHVPIGFAKTILRAPGLERIGQAALAFLETLDHQVFYNSRHASELLQASGVRCPAVDTYVEHLVRYIREVHDVRQRQFGEEMADPLD